MRKLVSVFLVVLTVAVLGTRAGEAHGTNRPFKGRGSGSVIADLDGLTIDGTVHVAHLGKSTFHTDLICTNADCSTSNFTTTIVAANGDTLIDSGTGITTAFEFTNQDTITGGTGRFAGASGTFTTTGTIVPDPSNPLAFTITFTSRGTISY